MPDRPTIWRWGEKDQAFATAIAQARNHGFDERAEKAVELAQAAQDARLAFDAERWYLSKLNPKRYGERTTIAGDPDAPLIALGDIDIAAEIVALLAPVVKQLPPPTHDASDLA
jgi:hypothetical protein